jgi:RNA polymerase sigma-70 factor, ECF subfamily
MQETACSAVQEEAMTAPPTGGSGPAVSAEELELLAALRRGDEAAYTRLVEGLHGSMLRLAMVHVGDRAVAEEVVQDAWLGVLRQLDRFEGRSSLKTWALRIVSNRAKTRAVRERRTVPFSALAARGEEAEEPAVEPERFLPAGDRWAGHWASPPASWRDVPEDVLLSRETMTEVERAVDRLPAAQRAVLVARDVEGLSAAEACQLLGLSEGNQRVLLHRARSRVRGALERYLDAAPRTRRGGAAG